MMRREGVEREGRGSRERERVRENGVGGRELEGY